MNSSALLKQRQPIASALGRLTKWFSVGVAISVLAACGTVGQGSCANANASWVKNKLWCRRQAKQAQPNATAQTPATRAEAPAPAVTAALPSPGDPFIKRLTTAAKQTVPVPTVGSFTRVMTNGNYPVFIYMVPKGQETIRVTAKSRAVEHQVSIAVVGNTLHIGLSGSVQPKKTGLHVQLFMSKIDALTVNGTGVVTGVNLRSHDLDVSVNGAGNVYLTGDKLRLGNVASSGQGRLFVSQKKYHLAKQTSNKPKGPAVDQFNKIVTNGYYPVDLYSVAPGKEKITISANRASLERAVTARVNNGTLYLGIDGKKIKPGTKDLRVKVSVSRLSSLIVNGLGAVRGHQLASDGLAVTANSSAPIILKGKQLALQTLSSTRSTGDITITGIRSGVVSLASLAGSKSAITLSGPRVGLHELDVNGQGPINISGVIPQALTVRTTNSGPVNIHGNVDLVSLTANGTGDLNIDNVQTAGLDITDTGTGNINLLGDDIKLATLHYGGSGNLNVYKINSPNLCIESSGSGTVNLTGEAALKQLTATGKSTINLLWLNSGKTKVWVSGSSHVHLAGIATELTAQVSKTAKLDAKYLRANASYLSTYDTAAAAVWSKKRLYAKAQDQSNIYYYNNSPYLAKYSGGSGAVLPMIY